LFFVSRDLSRQITSDMNVAVLNKDNKNPRQGRGLMRQNTLFVTFQIRAQKHPDRVGVEDDDGDVCTGFS
jgi:hypothetical protein